MKKKHYLLSKFSGGLFIPMSQMILFSSLILSVLILTLFGGTIYKNVVFSKNADERQRATLAYIQSKVCAYDEADVLSVDNGTLLLKESDSGYVTKIYENDGGLYEELALSGQENNPDSGEKICSVSNFFVELSDNGLLTIVIDGKTAVAAIKSAGG